MSRRKLLLETFEDRILCSATAPADAAPEVKKDVPATTATTAEHDAHVTPDAGEAASGAAQPAAKADAADAQKAERHEIVFVDTGAENYQQLVDDLLRENEDGRQMEVILLDANRDGIAQINEALAGRQDIDAIHFVTHGTDHAVQLGSTWIDGAAFQQFRDQIVQWGNALTDEADLLFYGCDLAGSEAGRQLLNSFSSVTKADIEASTDDTGSAALGANWTLDTTSATQRRTSRSARA